MTNFSKKEKKARAKKWQDAERAELLASMPLSLQQLDSLLDFLDTNLESCDHTTKLTAVFLHNQELNKERVLSWLADHGGHCDCEVLGNLDDLAQALHDRSVAPKIKPKTKKRDTRDLNTLTGWDFSALPSPWRIANLYADDEPLRIQMGKKSGCTITVVEASMPEGNQLSDDYWSDLWYARTELPVKSPLRVTRAAIDLPEDLRSTLVQISDWIPVLCWIVPNAQEWYLELQTEQNRQQGDLPQVSQLVTHLAKNKL